MELKIEKHNDQINKIESIESDDIYPSARRLTLYLSDEMQVDEETYANRYNDIIKKHNLTIFTLFSALILILVFAVYSELLFISDNLEIAYLIEILLGLTVTIGLFFVFCIDIEQYLAATYSSSKTYNVLRKFENITSSGWKTLILDNQIFRYKKNGDLECLGDLNYEDQELLNSKPDDAEFHIRWNQDKTAWRLASLS